MKEVSSQRAVAASSAQNREKLQRSAVITCRHYMNVLTPPAGKNNTATITTAMYGTLLNRKR